MYNRVSTSIKFLLIILLLTVLFISRFVIILTLIGVGIGVLISPTLDFFQKWFKLRRGFGAIILIIGVWALIGVTLILFGQILIDQTNALIEGMPEFSLNFQAKLKALFIRFPWVLTQIKDFDFAGTIQKGLQYIFEQAQSGFSAGAAIILTFIIGLYLAVDRDYYFMGLIKAFLPQHRMTAHNTLIQCANVVRVWFRAQLIDMAIIGLITTLGLWIVGVNYWAFFGFLTALFGIIPYIGIMIVVVIVSLITLASDGGQLHWILLVFFISQQIEGNIVLPMVMKGQAEIPEVLLIITILLFGFWFNLIGVFIAPPVLVVIICLYRELYLPLINNSQNIINE